MILLGTTPLDRKFPPIVWNVKQVFGFLPNNTHANQATPKTFVFKYDFTPDHPTGQKVSADCMECETCPKPLPS